MEQTRERLRRVERCLHQVFLRCLRRPVSRHCMYPFVLYVLDIVLIVTFTSVDVAVNAAARDYIWFCGIMLGIRVLDVSLMLYVCNFRPLLSVVQLIVSTILVAVIIYQYIKVEDESSTATLVMFSCLVVYEALVVLIVAHKHTMLQEELNQVISLQALAIRAVQEEGDEPTAEEREEWREAKFYVSDIPETDELMLCVPRSSAVLKWFLDGERDEDKEEEDEDETSSDSEVP